MKHVILENSALKEEVLMRFCVKHTILENSALYIVKNKPWFAQKIAAVLGETVVPEYPQEPVNILHAPSYQVNILTETNVQLTTVKAAVMENSMMRICMRDMFDKATMLFAHSAGVPQNRVYPW